MAIKNFVEELEWRGMIHSIMPGTQEQLQKEMSTAYVGIDPTADSLHIGHLVSVMILKHFQMCGHRPIALVGGATGMIGDPSGKSQERNLLDEKTLRHNQEAIKKQLAKLLDFESDAPNAAMLVNNYDWMKGITFLDFIRDIGKLITVNYMMAKDSVKKRFNGEGEGMSFTEFTYQLVQAYDFLHLYETVGCKLPLSVLPNLVPSALVISGQVRAKASPPALRRISSVPVVMLPHWSAARLSPSPAR